MLGWAEFACWTVVVLTPFFWWLNGPAVSTDQFVVRTAVTVLAVVVGVSLRIANVVRKRRRIIEGKKGSEGEGEV